VSNIFVLLLLLLLLLLLQGVGPEEEARGPWLL
jgi:hypothetical protein